MLPYLEPKKAAGVIMMKMKSNSPQVEKEEGEMTPEMMMAAESLISAIHTKSAKAVAEALMAAFHMADAMPHVEGPHEENE